MIRKTRITFALLALAALVAGAAYAGNSVDETRKLAEGGTVVIENISGSVEVTGWDKKEVHVTGTLGDDVEELRITGDENRLEFEVKLPDRSNHDGDATLVFHVPRTCSVEVSTVSAGIDVGDVNGSIDLESVSGDVAAGGKAREVNVETVSGGIELTVDSPQTEAQSVSGDIALSKVSGEVRVESVSGDVGIDGENVGRLRAETVSGDFAFEGSLAKDANFSIASHSGDVGILIPGNTDAAFEVSSFSGDVENDLSKEAKVHTSEYVKSKSVEFELGKGSGRVRIETFSGDVELRKK